MCGLILPETTITQGLEASSCQPISDRVTVDYLHYGLRSIFRNLCLVEWQQCAWNALGVLVFYVLDFVRTMTLGLLRL
jgi:hypothetical protein